MSAGTPNYLIPPEVYQEIQDRNLTNYGGKPNVAQLMERGLSFADASNLLYGSVGAAPDLRNWSAIMAADNPIEAAQQATGQLNSNPAAQAYSNQVLAGSGYTPISSWGDSATMQGVSANSPNGLYATFRNRTPKGLTQFGVNLSAGSQYGGQWLRTDDPAALANQLRTNNFDPANLTLAVDYLRQNGQTQAANNLQSVISQYGGQWGQGNNVSFDGMSSNWQDYGYQAPADWDERYPNWQNWSPSQNREFRNTGRMPNGQTYGQFPQPVATTTESQMQQPQRVGGLGSLGGYDPNAYEFGPGSGQWGNWGGNTSPVYKPNQEGDQPRNGWGGPWGASNPFSPTV